MVLPTGDVKISDGPFTTGEENYKEFWNTLVGLAGESQNFDGNGSYVRFQPGGGADTISTGQASLSGDTLFGNAVARPLGTRPKYPGRRPPYKPDQPCYQQTPPDLNGPAAEIGPGDTTVSSSAFKATQRSKNRLKKSGLAAKLAAGLNPFQATKGDAKTSASKTKSKTSYSKTSDQSAPITAKDATP